VGLSPAQLAVLDGPCDDFYHHKMNTSSLMLNMWRNISEGKASKVSSSSADDVLDIEKFVLALGMIAMQVGNFRENSLVINVLSVLFCGK
jgi:hypothetical protein